MVRFSASDVRMPIPCPYYHQDGGLFTIPPIFTVSWSSLLLFLTAIVHVSRLSLNVDDAVPLSSSKVNVSLLSTSDGIFVEAASTTSLSLLTLLIHPLPPPRNFHQISLPPASPPSKWTTASASVDEELVGVVMRRSTTTREQRGISTIVCAWCVNTMIDGRQ